MPQLSSLLKSYSNFGYNPKKSVTPQLCNALELKLSSPRFLKIQKVLENIREKHLDTALPFSNQPERVVLALEEIKKKYPDLFDGDNNEKKLYFAIRFIVRAHQKYRMRIGQERKKSSRKGGRPTSKRPNIENEILDLVMDSEDSEEEEENNSESCIRIGNPTRLGAVTLMNSRGQVSPTAGPSRGTNKPGSSRNTDAQKAPRNASQANPGPITFVHQFLCTCAPPMGHFLQRFIDFGCSNEEFLRGLSEWAPHSREKLLKKILAGPNNQPISEMELAVLENRFESYKIMNS